MNMWTNPPLEFLEKEISPFPEWIVWHALISPRLVPLETKVTALGADSYRVRFVIQNEGWLPTYVTKKALERKVTRGVIAEIVLPKGASLESGKAREELGELEGRAYGFSAPLPEDLKNVLDALGDKGKSNRWLRPAAPRPGPRKQNR